MYSNDNDPREIAVTFCKKFGLNGLAVQIVQGKVMEAKEREENKLRKIHKLKQKGFYRFQGKEHHIKNNKINHSSKEHSFKSTTYKIDKSIPKNKQKVQQKTIEYIGNNLYMRSLRKTKQMQQNRIKQLKQMKTKQQKQLTFKPKINLVSKKIVSFRRMHGYQQQKENKKQQLNKLKLRQEIDQMRNCTFKPQINHVSQLIIHNKHTNNVEYDHFTALYKNAAQRKQKLHAKLQGTSMTFQPKINIKSRQKISQSFEQRLQKSLIKNKEIKEGIVGDYLYSFCPKVGRGPKDNLKQTNAQWWNNLYQQMLKKDTASPTSILQQSNAYQMGIASNNYYQNLLEERIGGCFTILDGDGDGLISPHRIQIQKLTKNQLVFLKPVFQEMDQLNATLDLISFKKAVVLLLNDSDLYSKGVFLTQKYKKAQQQTSFTPSINKKSKQIALNRITTTNNVHQQLYQQGLKKLQQKQYKLQLQRTKIQKKELQECSFKPFLNDTAKYYIQNVLGKRYNQKNDKDLFFND